MALIARSADVTVDAHLTTAELARAAAFVREEDRHDYVAAHLLVREAAAELLGSSPRGVVLVQSCTACGGPHGKPSIEGSDVHVSLAHTLGWVAAVASRSPCGIDIEVVGPHVPASALTPAEQAWVADQADREEASTRLWVRKEALVKAGVAALDDLGSLDVLHHLGVTDLPTPPGVVAAVAQL